MPIYEYDCPACSGKFQKLVRSFSDPADLACPRCGNADVRRAVSLFATLTSEDVRMESLADPANFASLDEGDPRSIARWAKKMGKELGEDAGEDWDQLVDEMLDEELGGDDETDDPEMPGSPKAAKKANNLGWG